MTGFTIARLTAKSRASGQDGVSEIGVFDNDHGRIPTEDSKGAGDGT